MKKLLLLLAPFAIFMISCTKQDLPREPIDESEWLRQERGYVVASDFSCSYYVVETSRGYSILRNWGGSSPFPGEVMYGNFSNYGVRTFYNRSGRYLMNADVNDYWLSYFAAMDQIQWLCGDIYNMRKADSTLISTDSLVLRE